MRHIITTRYNLPLTFSNSDTASVRAKETWLKNRKILFDKYCLPTLQAQTEKNFKWFIGFAPDTPPEYYDYLEDTATPIFAETRKQFREKIVAELDKGRKDTIISRLDNDDGLAKSFVETVQKMSSGIFAASDSVGMPHVLNFRRGYEIDDRSGEVFTRDFPNSSFFSFLQKSCDAYEIFNLDAGHHAHVSKSFPVTNVSLSKPMWLISVHGDNIGNSIVGKKINSDDSQLGDFFGVK